MTREEWLNHIQEAEERVTSARNDLIQAYATLGPDKPTSLHEACDEAAKLHPYIAACRGAIQALDRAYFEGFQLFGVAAMPRDARPSTPRLSPQYTIEDLL